MCHTAEKEIVFGLVQKLSTINNLYFFVYLNVQVAPSYELYMVLEPMTTKVAVINAANSVLKVIVSTFSTLYNFVWLFFFYKWAKREEETHFITTSGSW